MFFYLSPTGAATGDKTSADVDPQNRSSLTHTAQILMAVDRPDPNSCVQCDIARDAPHIEGVGSHGSLFLENSPKSVHGRPKTTLRRPKCPQEPFKSSKMLLGAPRRALRYAQDVLSSNSASEPCHTTRSRHRNSQANLPIFWILLLHSYVVYLSVS